MSSRAIKKRPSTKKKYLPVHVLSIVGVICAFVAAGVIGVGAACQSWLQDLPDYADADAFNTALPTTVYASDGTTVLAEFMLEDRRPVTRDQISEYVLKGTVATEDERFYDHGGVDYVGIARAVVNNLTGGELEGASTITQQLVRNTILSSEMDDISLKRKVREAYISMKMEEIYSKDDILLMYLNTINYGSSAYGIQAASQRYFSKDANQLTLAEAATLIGIPQSPTYNNPIDNPENCIKRRNVVLDRMLSNNVITQEEHDAAQAEPLTLNPSDRLAENTMKYPYFTSYVRYLLTDTNGKYKYSRDEVLKGGLTVTTTLDVSTQEAAEEAAAKKQKQANSYMTNDPFEVAMVAIDPDNGHVKALVGGDDYDADQVNMATGLGGTGRQAGSAFKTFTLVAALEAGISPKTMVDCSTTVEYPGWKVSNIDYHNYGTRSIARAFAVSSNTGFARLIMSIGPEKVVDVAKRMGITSSLQAVGSLTLGSDAVTPLEMADAYATLANGGVHYDAECILRIVDRNGAMVVDNSNPTGTRVVTPEVAHAAVEVMKGVINTYEGTATDAALSNGQVAAGKTGTSENRKDRWFCGITPQLSVAIWMGDRSDLVDASSIPSSLTCASAFADFMNVVLKNQATENFPDAADPPYDTSFYDSDNHIGSGYYSSSNNSSSRNYSSSSSNSSNSNSSSEDDSSTSSSSSNGSNSSSNSSSSQDSSSGSDSGSGSGSDTGGGGDTDGGGSDTSGGGDTGGGDSGGDTGGGE